MDLKVYYTKLREVEKTITTPIAVIVSLETPDGGKAGVMTEVSSFLAARMIVEGKARLASKDEVTAFQKAIAEKQKAHEGEMASSRMKFAVLSDAQFNSLKGTRPGKSSD